jgi:hypothetical protein
MGVWGRNFEAMKLPYFLINFSINLKTAQSKKYMIMMTCDIISPGSKILSKNYSSLHKYYIFSLS